MEEHRETRESERERDNNNNSFPARSTDTASFRPQRKCQKRLNFEISAVERRAEGEKTEKILPAWKCFSCAFQSIVDVLGESVAESKQSLPLTVIYALGRCVFYEDLSLQCQVESVNCAKNITKKLMHVLFFLLTVIENLLVRW